jgi:hypothetical protein
LNEIALLRRFVRSLARLQRQGTTNSITPVQEICR